MRVRSVMSRDVVSVPPEERLLEAARRMRSDGVSALPVRRGEEVVGIISERDLVEALIDRVDTEETPVSEYMSSDPQYASPDDDSSDLALRMLYLGIRHLPVVEADRLVGMVSMRDLLLEALPDPTRAGPSRPQGYPKEPGA